MANVDLTPLVPHTITSTEASNTISAGMGVTGDGLTCPASTPKQYVGVAKFDAAPDEAITVEYGLVNVLVTATVTALDLLAVSSTAGKFVTATDNDPIVGVAIDARTGAGTVRAYMYSSAVYQEPVAEQGSLSFGDGQVASLADTASVKIGAIVSQSLRTISAVTAFTLTTCTDAEDHIIIDLYKSVAGTQTKIWSVTTAADWTDAGLAMVVETGGAVLEASAALYAVITNETGSAIVPGVVWFDVTATID